MGTCAAARADAQPKRLYVVGFIYSSQSQLYTTTSSRYSTENSNISLSNSVTEMWLAPPGGQCYN